MRTTFARRRTIGSQMMYVPNGDAKYDINPEYVVKPSEKSGKISNDDRKRRSRKAARASRRYNFAHK